MPLVKELPSGTKISEVGKPPEPAPDFTHFDTPTTRSNPLVSILADASFDETRKIIDEYKPHPETMKVVLHRLADNEEAVNRIRYVLGDEKCAEIDEWPLPPDLGRKGEIPQLRVAKVAAGKISPEDAERERQAQIEAMKAQPVVKPKTAYEVADEHRDRLYELSSGQLGQYVHMQGIGGPVLRILLEDLKEHNFERFQQMQVVLGTNVFVKIMDMPMPDEKELAA